jgi:hypothetical protein
MNTDDRRQSFNIRIKTAIQHVVRSIGRGWFDVLVSSSAACHMSSCAGFVADQDLVQRYLGTRRK